jgi:FixJ family two-component response regulator
MPEHTGDKAIVYIVDDDDSLRRAVDSLCRSVGLQSRASTPSPERIGSPSKLPLGAAIEGSCTTIARHRSV